MPRAMTAVHAVHFFLAMLPVVSGAAGETAVPGADELAQRRAKVLEMMEKSPAKDGVLLLRAPPRGASGDVDLPFQQAPDLLYLTGLDQPRIALLLSVREIEGLGRAVLFLPPPGPGEGVWVTRKLNPALAGQATGIPEGSCLLEARLPEVLQRAIPLYRARPAFGEGVRPRLYFESGAASAPGEPIPEPYAFLLARLGTAAFHLELRSPAELTAPLRQLKSPCELRFLERAIEITCEGHKKAMRAARPGVGEAHLAALIEFEFRSRGARGSSFTPIVASGPNACILHYDRHDRTVAGGDLVLLDIGADFAGYAADVSRTIPATGRFTERQKRLYRIVYEAQEASLRSIKPGVALDEVIQKATDGVAEGLLAMGLIKDRKDVGKYLPHRTSHGIGLDVHDAIVSKLAAGMVITVEPGIYIPEEGLGIRIEDDALVTESGYRLLSGGAPRSPEDVERWLGAREF